MNTMRRKIGRTWLLVLLMLCVFSIGSQSKMADAKKVQASVVVKQLSVGKQLSIRSKTDRVSYQSSDSTIASVSAKGVVTGKSAGKVNITVKRSGYQSKKIALTVKAVKGKPSLDVALDEVRLQSVKMKKTGNHKYQYSAVVRNNAKRGNIARIEYYYQIQVREPFLEMPADQASTTTQAASSAVLPPDTSKKWISRKRTVVLVAKNVKAHRKSTRVRCEGDASGKVGAMNLTKVKMYTGEAVYTYQVARKRGKLSWSNVDLTGPVITGWVGKKSVYQGEPIWLCYSDMKNTYHFEDHVKAVDARDGKVSVSVDTSRINWNKEGIYKVYYTAKDKSGNRTKAWAKVQVCKPGTAEQIAD
ncbi:MAG: Ig-like domain-containing protein, partial [Lachnospiraceae bacterium]|nr:Ig-like domain-containing protein [Lachnospiraceae bacterium]